MQITLKQAELEVAVRDYIRTMGIASQIGEVAFSATRGAEGITTTVEVGITPPANSAPAAKLVACEYAVAAAPASNEGAENPLLDDATPPGKSLFGG